MSAALMPAAAFVVQAPTRWAIFFISLAFLGHQFWSVILQTLPADLYPQGTVGSVAGLIGASGSFGSMMFALIVGYIFGTYASYVPGVFHRQFAPSDLIHFNYAHDPRRYPQKN